jgi:hypothetical protein
LVPDPSRLEVKIAVAKLKKYKSPASDDIPAELIQAGGETLLSAFHKLINFVWNKEELHYQWKEFIIIPVYKKGDNNYRVISQPSTLYKFLLNILLSMLSPYTNEIIEDHQCRIRRNGSNTDQIFCIRQILERKKRMSSETVY